jgi:hypothetical protein
MASRSSSFTATPRPRPFSPHPALAGAWNSDVEDYLRYDLTGPDGALRSRVVEAAVRTDGREPAVIADRLTKAAG